MYSTRIARHVAAPPAAVYRALLDPAAIAKWRVPDGMSSQVHEFEAREGGSFLISPTACPPPITRPAPGWALDHLARLVEAG